MPSADQTRSSRERDKLTIAEVCADLGISRRTFYEWRAGEGPGPQMHHAAEWQPAHPPVRIPALAGRIRGSCLMSDGGTTYDVRVYRTEVYKGVRVTTYRVRWKTGYRPWREGFRTAAQADSFRSALLTAARKGEAFSLTTGRPTAWERAKADISWYDFACAYVDMKWKQASAKYRKDIARALTAATPAMLAEARGRPNDASIRRALVRWALNAKQRTNPPEDVAEVLAWVTRASAPVSELAEPATARRMLELATGTVDGKNAAASTARRHRSILANAMDYAIERGLLDTNPIRGLKWTTPKVSSQVDRRSVVNPRQARALLAAVRAQQPSGPRLVGFFAVMYYAGLRPEEAINLRQDNLVFPPCVWDEENQQWQDPPDDQDWGELHLRSATPDAGSEWTDDGSSEAAAAQAPGRRRHSHRADPPRTDQAAPRSPRQLRPDRGRPPICRRPGWRATHNHLPARVDQSPPDSAQRGRTGLTACPAAI